MDGVIPLIMLLLLVAFVVSVPSLLFIGYKVFFGSDVEPRYFWTSAAFTMLTFISTLVAWVFRNTGVGNETWLYFLAIVTAWTLLTIFSLRRAFAW